MDHIAAIFRKQLKDTLKNKTVFIQFILFPLLTLIMSRAVTIDGMPENFFVTLFATMYVGMAPLTSMAAVIAEEKEKNTLRVLLLSDVKPYEYLLGVGSYLWLFCMLGALVICLSGSYTGRERLAFLAILAIGILASLLVGAAIGTASKTQMMATGITLPVMMVFSFLPMLSLFNSTIAGIAKFVYTEQLNRLLNQVAALEIEMEQIWIVAGNLFLFAALFTVSYKKCGLD